MEGLPWMQPVLNTCAEETPHFPPFLPHSP